MSNSITSLTTCKGVFRVAIDGDAAAPALMLSNSLGTTLEMWEPQVASFSKSYRLIRYDTRGHGGSPVTPGPYTFDSLGHDALAVLDALGVEKAAFCGISMGGHTGLWLGIHASAFFNAIVICNSAAKIGSTQAWNERALMVRENGRSGMQALAKTAPERWFTKSFFRDHPTVVQRVQAGLAGTSPEGYAACCEALAHSDLRSSLDCISVPTLLLAGVSDPVTTVADAQAMQACIVGSQLAVLSASHLSNLQAPQAFEKAVLDFMSSAHDY